MPHNFGLVSHFPFFEFRKRGGPMGIIKVGDRNIELVQVKRVFGKFFVTNLGVFELDGEYEYKMDGQILYFFNIYNCKPLSLRAVEDIQNKYKTGDNNTIVEEIKDVEKAVTIASETKSPVAILSHLANKEEGKGLKPLTKKFLVDQKLYDESDAELFQSEPLITKKALPKISGQVGTIIPMTIFATLGILIMVIMNYLPHWLNWF